MAGIGWALPAGASAGAETIRIKGVATGIPADCARVGDRNTSVPAQSQARWGNVQATHVTTDQGSHATPVADCVDAIFATMQGYARALDASSPQLLRAALFSGLSNLSSPYQVFLDNIYISTMALASLSPTSTPATTGLASCVVSPDLWLLDCNDDSGGRVLMRNADGSPLRDWAGNPVYLNLSGALSAQGGTMYGSVFFRNLDVHTVVGPLGGLLEKHEQVHAQQWSQYSWDFANRYISEAAGDYGDHLWHLWTTGQNYQPACFNAFERAANFHWGGYTFCPSSWL